MKYLKKILVLECGLMLLSITSFKFNNTNTDLSFSTNLKNENGISLRKASSNETISIGQTYVQTGANKNNRLLRFATPVSGNFNKITYYVTIDNYQTTPIQKEVNTIYKGIEDSNNIVNYFNGSQIVNEEDELTSTWYWACFTIEFSTYEYYSSNISSYLVASNDVESKESTKKDNVNLSQEISSTITKLDNNLINIWKNNNYRIEVSENKLTLNETTFKYTDYKSGYVFTNNKDYLILNLNENKLNIKGSINQIEINEELNALVDCPITFEEKKEVTVGDNEITFTIPEGVEYIAHYEKDEKFYSNYGSLPTEAGIYSLVVQTIENNQYKATKKWLTFTINKKAAEDKTTPTISFDFEPGTSYALGIEPTFKIKDSNGNILDDVNYTINYTSDTTGYSSDKLPTIEGDYGLTVTIIENDKYNTVSKNIWFNIRNEILTTITSDVSTIYEGALENIIDGDENTYCWFGASFKEGNYIQIDYSIKRKLNKLSYLFDKKNNTDYYKFSVQYLNGNNEYETTSAEVDSLSGIVSFDKIIETKSLRVVSTKDMGTTWAKPYELKAYLGPTTINNGFTFVSGSSLDYLSDNNINTYTFFDWHYTSSNNVVVDYLEETEIKNIMLLSGCEKSPDDYFRKVKLSYSLDNITYTDLDGEFEGKNIYVDLTNKNIKARYIKATPIIDGESSNGVTIREFGINMSKFNVSVTFGEDTVFDYDGAHHEPSFSIPYGAEYNYHFTKDEGVTTTQEAIDEAYWALVIDPIASPIYNFTGKLFVVFRIGNPQQ